MVGEGLLRPIGCACERVVMWVIVAEVIGEFTTDNEFFKERFEMSGLEGDVLGGNVAEVEIGGEVGEGVFGGVIAVSGIGSGFVDEEMLEGLLSRLGTWGEPSDGFDLCVDV